MTTRGDVLELAILGELLVSELHGYELRKRLNMTLGTIRTLSYGSLYPCLKRLGAGGWIEQTDTSHPRARGNRRARIVYRLTPAGRRRLADSLADVDPAAWDDESFTVRFSLFAETTAEARAEILQGRRAQLVHRRSLLQQQLRGAHARWDRYTLELQRHGLDNLDDEITWLDGLIAAERGDSSTAETSTSDAGVTSDIRAQLTKPQASRGSSGYAAAPAAADQAPHVPATDRPHPKEN